MPEICGNSRYLQSWKLVLVPGRYAVGQRGETCVSPLVELARNLYVIYIDTSHRHFQSFNHVIHSEQLQVLGSAISCACM